MPLTDTAIRNAKPREKQYKLSDEKGLYLLVNKVGKYFRYDYRFGGKRKTLALGVYPTARLPEAREKRDEARKLIVNGVDPAQHRKETKAVRADQAANTFKAVAREWFTKNMPKWTKKHAKMIIRRLELNVFPWLGSNPISDIAAPDL